MNNFSNLAVYFRESPHKNPRKNSAYNPTGKIDAIAIHHMAGNGSVETCGNIFADPERGGSSNYGVGSDGRIGGYVPEDYRSWCTSSREVDYRAITIEVANCSYAPDWKVSDKALEALIELCVDICRRHGFTLNYTGGKDGNLHMHKWYDATSCPGPYLGSKFPYIAKEVNRRLGVVSEDTSEETKEKVNTEGYEMNMRLLRKGCEGEDVRALQILLKGNGYDLGKYGPKKDGVDGQYGAATAAAVRKLQVDRKLGVDEIAGPEVMGSLLGL